MWIKDRTKIVPLAIEETPKRGVMEGEELIGGGRAPDWQTCWNYRVGLFSSANSLS